MTDEYRGVPLYGPHHTGDPMCLEDHEKASQARYESLCEKVSVVCDEVKDVKDVCDNIETIVVAAATVAAQVVEASPIEIKQVVTEENEMGMDNISDRVNINLPGGSGDGGGGMAAVIAALGNRNQGNDNAALIAALGNRNDDSANMMGPMMAMLGQNRNQDGGMNSMWPILLLALLGRGGRGGLFGGGGDDCGSETRVQDNTANLAILSKLGNIEAAVPLAEAQTQNAILEQTINTNQQFSTLTAGLTSGLINLKDTVVTAGAANLSATNNVGQQVLITAANTAATIREDGERTRALIIANQVADLQRQLTVADLDRRDSEHRSRTREVEVNVSQNVQNTATAAQAQFQAQLQQQKQSQDFAQLFGVLSNQINAIHQGVVQIGAGNLATPTNTNTNVR